MSYAARQVFVSGRVQGVAFRWSAREAALSLGIRGWVRNLHDGRVETRIEGEPEALEQMLAWLRRGPPSAHVERVTVEEVPAEGHEGYEITRTRH